MRNLLIIGAGSAGKMVANEICEQSELSKTYRLIGFLDDDEVKKNVLNIPVLGKIENAGEIIKERHIDEVIIAIPSAGKETIDCILSNLAETKRLTSNHDGRGNQSPVSRQFKIKIVPGIYEIIQGKASFQQVRDIEAIDLLGREEVGFDIEKISPYYRDKTVFVTGAGGSIGSEILKQLFQLPVKKVAAFGHGEHSIYKLTQKMGSDIRFRYVIGDVKDIDKLEYEMKRHSVDIVFHAAAYKHVPIMEEFADEAVKNNILGAYNACKAAIKNNVKKFVLISSDKAVNPVSIMGASKRIAELIVLYLSKLQRNTAFSVIRFGNVLNSRGSVVPLFEEQINNGGPITVTRAEVSRYFMSLREAARLVIKSATLEQGRIYALDMGEPVKILDLAQQLIRLHGYGLEDIPIEFIGLRKGEKLVEELSTKKEELSNSIYQKILVSSQNCGIAKKNDLDELNRMMDDFIDLSGCFDKEKIVKTLKKYVPEFKENE